MAGKHPACPVLQSSSEPAGGRSRMGAAWVGRIRAPQRKARGTSVHGECVNAEEEYFTELRVLGKYYHLQLSICLL